MNRWCLPVRRCPTRTKSSARKTTDRWTESFPLVSEVKQVYGTARSTAARWTKQIQLGGQLNQGNTQTDLINVAGVFEQNTKDHMRQINTGGQWGAQSRPADGGSLVD